MSELDKGEFSPVENEEGGIIEQEIAQIRADLGAESNQLEHPYSLDNFKNLLRNIDDKKAKINKAALDEPHKEDHPFKLEEGGDIYTETLKRMQDYYINIIEELKKGKQGLKYIFQTEKGSIYFVLFTGESLRFRKTNGLYEDQPIGSKISFVNYQDFSKISAKPKKGLVPLEERSISYMPQRDMNTDFFIDDDSIHYGHKITEILHQT